VNDGVNIGIGVATPQALLHIENADAVLRIAATGGGSGQAPEIEFYRASTLRGQIGTEDFNGGSILSGTPGDALSIRSEDALWFGTNGNNTRMMINTSGNVGIGTTAPDRKLDVLDTTNPQLRLTHTDSTIFVDFQVTAAGDLEINIDGQANQLVLDGGGNVGIGIAAPTAKLHIIQTAAADAFRVDDQASDTTPFIIDQNGNVGVRIAVPSGLFSLGEANGQQTTQDFASTEVVGMSGATVTASSLIPAGSFIIGVTVRVTTTITGATTFDIGDGTNVDRWGAAIVLTAGTTTDITDFTAAGFGQFDTANDVVLTANGANFTAGAVRITIHYMTLTAATS